MITNEIMSDSSVSQSSTNVNEKSKEILQDLYNNIKEYDREKVSHLLSEFRILTREKTLTDEILNERCLKLLVDCSKECHIESQKCLSNLILNYGHIRENLVLPYVECFNSRFAAQNSYEEGSNILPAARIKDESKTCEILYYDLRIIFLLSALCPGQRGIIRDRILNLILLITRHEAENYRPENHLLVIESLKTLFNLTLDKLINADLAAKVIRKLFSIVGTDNDSDTDNQTGAKLDPTDQLLVNLIHLLTNMPEKVYHELSDNDVNKVLHHLDEQLKTSTRANSRDTILPVLNACANICRYKEDVRQRWFDEIIGSTKDFEKRPEEYDTLRGRLVKSMTSVDVHIKEIAAEFLYALCGEDTEKFITYTGFGNSVAYLSTRGLLSKDKQRDIKPSETQEVDSQVSSDNVVESRESDKQYQDIRNRLNPITGKLEGPKRNPMDGMSEEEKEWHAHELSSAIAKLSKLGVMKPMNIDADGQMKEIRPGSPQRETNTSQEQENYLQKETDDS